MEDYVKRVVIEAEELGQKIIALTNFIQVSPIFEKLDNAEKARLNNQIDAMLQYHMILEERLRFM